MPRPPIEDAKPRLLAAGLSLFAKLGIERVNSNAIAKRAKVGVGTFYRSFEDKHALLGELQIRTLEGLRGARSAAVATAAEDPISQAHAAIGAALQFARSHPAAYRVTFGRERASATKHRPIVTESTRAAATALARYQAFGLVDPALNAELAARAFAATEVGMLLWWLEDLSRATDEEVIDTLLRLHPVVAARMEVEQR